VRAGLVAAVTVGVVSRVAVGTPLWLDEALSVNIAGQDLARIPEALRRDGHPPLYYWILHVWMRLVGEGDLAVRSLSVLIGLAALPLAWVAGRRLAGPAGARWALVVASLSPFAVRYSSEVRMYVLVMVLVAAGYLLLLDALDRPHPARLAGLAVVTGALLWTHYWSMFLLAVVSVAVLVRWWRNEGARRSAAGWVALSLAAGGVLFLPWVPSLLEQLSATGTPWAAPSRPTHAAAVTLDDLGGGGWPESRLHGAISLVLVLVALLGRRGPAGELVIAGRTVPTVRREVGVAVGALALGALVAFVGHSAYASRYAAIVVPLVLLAVAVGYTVLPAVLRWMAAAAWVGTALVGLAHNALVDRTESGDVARVLAAEVQPADVVAVCPDQLGVSLQRVLDQLDAGIEVRAYPAGGDPRFIDWRDYAARNQAADPVAFARGLDADAGEGAVWLYWNTGYRTFEGRPAWPSPATTARTASRAVSSPGSVDGPQGRALGSTWRRWVGAGSGGRGGVR
jgi:hypothetical protein